MSDHSRSPTSVSAWSRKRSEGLDCDAHYAPDSEHWSSATDVGFVPCADIRVVYSGSNPLSHSGFDGH